MELRKILIIGAGTMGRGIAQWFLQQNLQVTLTDSINEFSEKSHKLILESLETLSAKNKITTIEHSTFKSNLKTCEISEIESDYDLVVEAIIEDLKIKNELFILLDNKMKKETILATNTSSIPVKRIARNLSAQRQTRMIGLHFFNPATIMKLVEIIQTPWSDENIAKDLYTWFNSKGKKPAICKDYPGFIVNRVARNFYGESFQVLASNDEEKVKEIDQILKNVGGFKMGPFELMDLIGIDVNLDVTTSVWESYACEERFKPHRIQKEMVESGRIGKKVGRGFYEY